MNLKTFKWQMNMGASANTRHAVSKTQFGDGYAQRVSFGLNNKRCDWSGSKTGDYRTVILPIMAFLDEHQGIKPFLWTDPHGITAKYVCQDYEVSQRKGNFWQISLKFEQVFGGESIPDTPISSGGTSPIQAAQTIDQKDISELNQRIDKLASYVGQDDNLANRIHDATKRDRP